MIWVLIPAIKYSIGDYASVIYKVERLREREGGKLLSLTQKTRERGKEPKKMTAKKNSGPLLIQYIPFAFPVANTHAVVCQTMIQHAPLLQFRHLQSTGKFKKKILLKL